LIKLDDANDSYSKCTRQFHAINGIEAAIASVLEYALRFGTMIED
jgi:hypothetical protein